ncbi:MAG: AIR synthase related protein [Promethearchaeota archaeon]
MSDLEGLVRELTAHNKPKEEIIRRLVLDIQTYKPFLGEQDKENLAKTVYKEVSRTIDIPIQNTFLKNIFSYTQAQASMNKLGVGCRGEGDQFVHQLLAEIAVTSVPTFLGPKDQDDAGVVGYQGQNIAVAVDGTHSRLTDFPFLSGFHVTRAALRDIFVKGAQPVALLTDLHLADDGDVAKLFDFMAGIRAVSELSQVPLVAGSTLRIGGDMVIGKRFVSCVGCVGIINQHSALASRKNIQEGDYILCTENATGGGTIATTAIFSGNYEVVLETLNIRFLQAAQCLLKENLFPRVHAVVDWTNGGIRLDFNSMCENLGLGMTVNGTDVTAIVNPKVKAMLESLDIDYLGVSLDALVIFCPPENVNLILTALKQAQVPCRIIGKVVKEPKYLQLIDEQGKKERLVPGFRESAYTDVKKLVDKDSPSDKEFIKLQAQKAAKDAVEKANRVVQWIKNRG